MEFPTLPAAARRLSPGIYAEAAGILKCEEAAIRAVVAVEARSVGFDDRGRVLILNERHILHRRTSGDVRARLVAEGLARQTPGGYPPDQDARYAWLAKAIGIAGAKAYEAISMGFPQIMGFNHRAAGYGSARLMYEAFAAEADEHIRAMARFIAAHGPMLAALRGRDWPTFARLYNGPAYRKNRYDEKLAAAYARFARGAKSPAPLDSALLDRGDKGQAIRDLQNDLKALGYVLTADGDFGPMTEQAVKAFQRANGLTVDGKAGPVTLAAIETRLQAAQPPAEPQTLPTSASGGANAKPSRMYPL